MTMLDRQIEKAWAQHEPARNLVTPEAKRALRNFKRELAPVSARLEMIQNLEPTSRLIDDCCRKTGTGRAKAMARLKQTFVGARVAQTEGGLFIAWLHPVDCIYTNPDTPGKAQDAILVNFILANGRRRGAGAIAKATAIECPDHALGRLIQRGGPGLDLRTALFEAADCWMCGACPKVDKPSTIYLSCACGLLVGGVIFGRDKNGIHSIHFRADTWISSEQARPDQVPLPEAEGEAGLVIGVKVSLLRLSSAGFNPHT